VKLLRNNMPYKVEIQTLKRVNKAVTKRIKDAIRDTVAIEHPNTDIIELELALFQIKLSSSYCANLPQKFSVSLELTRSAHQLYWNVANSRLAEPQSQTVTEILNFWWTCSYQKECAHMRHLRDTGFDFEQFGRPLHTLLLPSLIPFLHTEFTIAYPWSVI
jgi:hypothetical protein